MEQRNKYGLPYEGEQIELPLGDQETKPTALIIAIVAVVAVAAVMFWTAFAHAAEPTKERLTFLMKFAAQGLDVYTYDVELPRIIYTSHDNLQLEYYGAKAMARLKGKTNLSYPSVTAIYRHGVMILDKSVDYTDPDEEYTLVHELTHYLQDVKGLDSRYKCLQGREPAAYHAQNMWVMASGHGTIADPLSIFLYSQCPRPYPH